MTEHTPPDFFGRRPAATAPSRAPRRPARRRPSLPSWRWHPVAHIVAQIVTAVGAMLAVKNGLPVLGHGLQIRWLAAGTALVLAAGTVAIELRPAVAPRVARRLAGALTVVTVLFAWGALHSPVVGGDAVLTTTARAAAVREARTLDADLEYLESLVPLLQLDGPAARDAGNQYAAAQSRLKGMEERLVALVEQRPTAQLVGAAQLTRNTAYWAVEALNAKQAALLNGSAFTDKTDATLAELTASLQGARGELAAAAATAPLSLTGADLDEVSS